MKRILFYVLLIAQLAVIFFLTMQFEKIDETGQMITLKTVNPDYPTYVYDNTMYVEYEINRISSEQWDKSDSIDYNDKIYVLLKRDGEGIFNVEAISANTLTTNKEDEIVLKGTYNYSDDTLHYHYVSYGLEQIKHVQQFGDFKGRDTLIISVLIGKWGQHKITAIERHTD